MIQLPNIKGGLATSERPTGGFILSLIGGIIIFLVGLLVLALASMINALIGATSPSGTVPGFVGVSMTINTIGIIGVVTGLLVIVSGVMMYVKPQQHVIWGVLALVFSIVSILGLGGFILGLILGLVGGILGIVFKPSQPMAAPMPQQWQAPPQ